MAIRFKFRSSVAFDCIDIGGDVSVSLRELKSRIVRDKKLNICRDSDLVFSDAITGLEYNDENVQIASGSSVIIKRVPVGTRSSIMAHLDSVKNSETKETAMVTTLLPVKVEMENFDDFGMDLLCPITEASSKKELENIEVPRLSEPPMVGCQKLEASHLNDASSGGHAHNTGGNTLQSEPKLQVDVQTPFGKMFNANPQAKRNAEFPSELNCLLCETFLKDAVMIPCCQQSFCEACIRLVLIQQRRCPNCLSNKYGVKDLLPNLSLRQAIEHFLKSQNVSGDSKDALCRYAPDGESGIQGKDISCAVSIFQKETKLLHHTSTGGRGSKQVMVEAAYDSRDRKDALEPLSDSQGENHPIREKGGDNKLMETGRQRKVISLNSRTMPDYVSPYWNGSPFHQNRPFPNLYCDPRLMSSFPLPSTPPMPFNASMYMSSVYGGIPAFPSGYMRVGGVPSLVGTTTNPSMNRPEFLQHCVKGWKPSNESSRRERSFDAGKDNYNSPSLYAEVERSHDRKSYVDREKTIGGYSSESFSQRSRRKHQLDIHLHDDIPSVEERRKTNSRYSIAERGHNHSERLSSEVEDKRSSSKYHGQVSHGLHHKTSERKRGRSDSGSDHGRSHGKISKDKDAKRRDGFDFKMHDRKKHSGSESGLEHSFPIIQVKNEKGKDSHPSSKYSTHSMKALHNHPIHDRWKMVSGFDEKDYQLHKRKKVH